MERMVLLKDLKFLLIEQIINFVELIKIIIERSNFARISKFFAHYF